MTLEQDREAVIRKVQKMLALGKDKAAFEAESNTALTLAAKWLEEFGLSMKDIEFDQNGQLKGDQMTEFKTEAYMLWPWEKELVGVVTRLMPVDFLWYSVGRGYKKMCWIGTKTDAEMAHGMWMQLRTNLKLLARDEESPIAKRSFLQGCVHTMIHRAKKLEDERKFKQAGDAGKALIVVKKDQIVAWRKQQYPNTRPTIMRGSDVDGEAYQRGQIAGKQVKLTDNKELK